MCKPSLYIVSQRTALKGDFVNHIKALVSASADIKANIKNKNTIKLSGIILREKDLDKIEYESIVKELAPFCNSFAMPLFLNADVSFSYDLAIKYNCAIHTSMHNFNNLIVNNNKIKELENVKLGFSIHSKEEAEFILEHSGKLNISHIIAGHIFNTDCKKGLECRGLKFLQGVKEAIKGAQFRLVGIGGINQDNMPVVLEHGADGIAVMSLAMQEEMSKEEAIDFLSSFAIGKA